MNKIRPATLTDLAQIIALDQEIFGSYGAEEEPQIIQARLELFPAGCAILTDHTDSPAFLGYLTTEKWATRREPALDEDPRLSHQPDGTVLCITTLAIAPAYQNRGLGKQILDHAIEIAQREQCTEIILETAHAKKFYLRHGFELIGTRRQRGILLYVMGLAV